jgi:pimeloyl-ACP methyl ester carboxylesterase
VLSATILLILVGMGFEEFGRRSDERRFPQVGRSIDIGGRSLSIYCSGSRGPTVVFDSGMGVPGYGWVFIQRQVAQSARACFYDRAGYGWSDSVASMRTSVDAATDLHELLRAAHISPPYVLVGHSLGGFNVRVYNGLYPEQVVGAVLIDASHEDMEARIPRWGRRFRPPSVIERSTWLAGQILARLGVFRLFTRNILSDPPSSLSKSEWATILGLAWTPKMRAASMTESIDESAEQARTSRTFGTRPLIVLTAGKHSPPRSMSEAEAADDQKAWEQLQSQLARLSSRGVQRVVANSAHMIPFEAPDTVVEAVNDIIRESQQP